jgi:hypothetical protein
VIDNPSTRDDVDPLDARPNNHLARRGDRIDERSSTDEEAEDFAGIRPTKESASRPHPERWKPPISISAGLERSTSRGVRLVLRRLGRDGLL